MEAPRKLALGERFESIKFWDYIHVDSFLVLAKNERRKMLSSSWLSFHLKTFSDFCWHERAGNFTVPNCDKSYNISHKLVRKLAWIF